jgi:hypothetical protein
MLIFSEAHFGFVHLGNNETERSKAGNLRFLFSYAQRKRLFPRGVASKTQNCVLRTATCIAASAPSAPDCASTPDGGKRRTGVDVQIGISPILPESIVCRLKSLAGSVTRGRGVVPVGLPTQWMSRGHRHLVAGKHDAAGQQQACLLLLATSTMQSPTLRIRTWAIAMATTDIYFQNLRSDMLSVLAVLCILLGSASLVLHGCVSYE